MERRSLRAGSSRVRRKEPGSGAPKGGPRSKARARPRVPRRQRTLPPWLTLIGSILFLVLCFGFVFFVARGCVAAQESTQVRKYVTSADSTLSDSANAGREELQAAVAGGLEDPASLNPEALGRVEDESQKYYLDALRNEEVPPEFEGVHHYMVSALGIRATATEELARATENDPEGFGEALSAAVGDFKLSDALVSNHYVPGSERALTSSGRQSEQAYLYEPEPFMDYEALGLSSGQEGAATPGDPNAVHGLEIYGVEVAGKALLPGGDVVLTGSDEPVFSVAVTNGGEVAETGVPVEVVLNTRAERQARSAEIGRIDPGATVAVEVSGFRPGELDESAAVSVEVGTVEYEQNADNNVLSGTVTFGI